MTYKELLILAEKKYPKNSDKSSAKLIMAKLANLSISELYAKLNDEIAISLNDFLNLVQEYLDGKPIQYIIGEQTFFGANFICKEGVFIARYETEELVENMLDKVQDLFKCDQQLWGADLGTGMGVIALSLASNLENSNIVGVDINPDSVKLARENQKLLNIKNVEFILGNMLEALQGKNIKFDFIVANPPYIDINSEIDSRVKDYEPAEALYAPNKGLYYYEHLFKNIEKYLNNKYLLGFEYGYDQKEQLEFLVREHFPNSEYKFLKDTNKKWRMLFIWKI